MDAPPIIVWFVFDLLVRPHKATTNRQLHGHLCMGAQLPYHQGSTTHRDT